MNESRTVSNDASRRDSDSLTFLSRDKPQAAAKQLQQLRPYLGHKLIHCASCVRGLAGFGWAYQRGFTLDFSRPGKPTL
jgi:hypothetical protein